MTSNQNLAIGALAGAIAAVLHRAAATIFMWALFAAFGTTVSFLVPLFLHYFYSTPRNRNQPLLFKNV